MRLIQARRRVKAIAGAIRKQVEELDQASAALEEAATNLRLRAAELDAERGEANGLARGIRKMLGGGE